MNCTPAALLCTCRKYAKIILSHVKCGAALALSLQCGYTANPITSLTEKGGGRKQSLRPGNTNFSLADR